MNQVKHQPNVAQDSANNKQAAPAAPQTVQQTPQAPSYGGPCKNTKSREESDTCAQWVAATAAKQTAYWEPKHYQVELWGAIGLGVSLIVSAIAAILGWRAFASTKRTEVAQTRAYMHIEKVWLADGTHHEIEGDAESIPGAVIWVKNFGQTPAHAVRHWGSVLLVPADVDFNPPDPDMGQLGQSTFPPTASNNFIRRLVDDPLNGETYFCLTEHGKQAVREHKYGLMIYGRITYRDVYGQRRKTNYRFIYTGKWPPPLGDALQVSICPRGNESD